MSSSPTPAIGPEPASRRWRGPILVGLLGAIVFANTLVNDFVYDDNRLIPENPRIRSLANLREIWLTDWWRQLAPGQTQLSQDRDRLYRPLTMQTFALDYAINGDQPFGYHVVNILLHALACILVWRLALRLFEDPIVAVVASALFAVHPVHCEAVAGIVGRAEILASVLMFAGLLTLLRPGAATHRGSLLLAAAMFGLSMMAKETSICYPAVAALALWYCTRQGPLSRRQWLVVTVFLLAPLVVYFPLRLVALEGELIRRGPTSVLFNPLFEATLWGRVHGPLTILGHYARLLVAPTALSCDYSYAVFDPHHGPALLTVVGLLAAALLALALAGWRSQDAVRSRLAILSAMFLASYVLISNTVLLIGVSVAERLMYWPSAFFAMAVGVAVSYGIHRKTPGRPGLQSSGVYATYGVVFALALAGRSALRNMDWRNDRTLFETDTTNWPRSAHLNTALAQNYLWEAEHTDDPEARSERLTQAGALLDRSLGIYSRYPATLELRGAVFAHQGDIERAIQFFERALALNPRSHIAQESLAVLRGQSAQRQSDAAELREKLEADPKNVDLRLAYGAALLALSDFDAALEQFQEAERLAPDNGEVLRRLGQALALNERGDEAIVVFERLLARDPRDWSTHANLAKLLSRSDPVASLQHARRAVELNPNDIRTQLNLGEALALNGDRSGALRHLRVVLRNLSPEDPFYAAVRDRIFELEHGQP